MINSRRLKWTGHVARMEEGRSAFKSLTDKPRGKRSSARPRSRWTLKKYVSIRGIGVIQLRIRIIGEPL